MNTTAPVHIRCRSKIEFFRNLPLAETTCALSASTRRLIHIYAMVEKIGEEAKFVLSASLVPDLSSARSYTLR